MNIIPISNTTFFSTFSHCFTTLEREEVIEFEEQVHFFVALVANWSNKPTKAAQLVRVNARRCGPNKRHMVLDSNHTINDTLIYPVLIVSSTVSTPRLSKKKNKLQVGQIDLQSELPFQVMQENSPINCVLY